MFGFHSHNPFKGGRKQQLSKSALQRALDCTIDDLNVSNILFLALINDVKRIKHWVFKVGFLELNSLKKFV